MVKIYYNSEFWLSWILKIVFSQDFKKGMNMYLTKFQQKNAATGNF